MPHSKILERYCLLFTQKIEQALLPSGFGHDNSEKVVPSGNEE